MQPVRGTHDLLPDEYRRFAHVVDAAREVARLYGYREMATPIFEFTELFARGIGETTDVVSKEMYTFQDRGGESLTLRPEYTAGICRAFVSNGELAQQLPLKIFAAGPMFRYERPQKGRQRQFHQIDLEVLGAPEPGADIEVISVARRHPRSAGHPRSLRAEAQFARRPGEPHGLSQGAGRLLLGAHRQAFARTRATACSAIRCASSTARTRATRRSTPTRRPSPTTSTRRAATSSSRCRTASRPPACRSRSIPRLVRGLDYYTHTAFEFVTTHIGAQGTVLGGGRYDGLIAELGGPPTAGIGWAGGIERLIMLANEPRGAAAAGGDRAAGAGRRDQGAGHRPRRCAAPASRSSRTIAAT